MLICLFRLLENKVENFWNLIKWHSLHHVFSGPWSNISMVFWKLIFHSCYGYFHLLIDKSWKLIDWLDCSFSSGDVVRGLRDFFPDVNWDFIDERKRTLSEKAEENRQLVQTFHFRFDCEKLLNWLLLSICFCCRKKDCEKNSKKKRNVLKREPNCYKNVNNKDQARKEWTLKYMSEILQSHYKTIIMSCWCLLTKR